MKRFLLIFLMLFTVNFSDSCNTSFKNQKAIDELTQTGIYYYWHGGDLKKPKRNFLRGLH